jgi:dolichol-phosphate mannosyltransferase
MDDQELTARAGSAVGNLALAIIVPTFNEAANVRALVDKLDTALIDIAWEAIFVDDDSPDGTAALVRQISLTDPRVRVIRRIGRRGLSTAVIEGMLATVAPAIAVIDGDMQHDERILPTMLETLHREQADMVVGSRYVDGGGTGDWDSNRVTISRFATWLGQRTVGVALSDPMSGFFMIRREVVEETVHDLSGVGFKILLDILASSQRAMKVLELPYEFRIRTAGQSKLDSAAMIDFGTLLLDKTVGRYVPVKFLVFSAIGGMGLLVHLLVLFIVHQQAGISFVTAQISATVTAMTFNYVLNNELTYRDRRQRGWQMLRGWVSFALACSVGAVANVGVAVYAYQAIGGEAFGWIWSAVAGVLVGAVWNYAVTAVYTWGNR